MSFDRAGSRHILLATIFLILGYGFLASPEFNEIAAGVAIFLFGMMCLEQGFKAFTGGTLERLLERTTNRQWKSFVFGVLATTLMQSSSLVSVITISFLSAGLLGLAQGIGIIFGANLGSTTGAWLVAGFGLKVDIAAYAMPMITFGVILVFNKSTTLKGFGYALTGLGFLFLGIHFMKGGFESFGQTIDLAAYAVPGVAGLLIFTLIGVFATVVMQSSHATLVLIITALAAQQITYENALALSIGANVGTTITALLGSISANIEGRRLAVAHVIFNVTTGAIALLFIRGFVAAVETGSAWLGISPDDHTLKLALFHSMFNLAGIALMLPLTSRLVVFLETRLKPKPRTVSTPKYINDGMIDMPDAALEAARKELQHLFTNVFDIMALVLHTDPARLRKGDGLEVLANAPERVRTIDVDDYYQRRVKPLHGSILDFLARVRTQGPQSRHAFILRASSQQLLEALKDLKHLQKNLVRHLVSPNPYLRKEYVAIRQHLALLLHELHQMANDPEANVTLTLDVLRVRSEEKDIVANGTLDQLIREKRISVESATSLMNDSAYARHIASNLLAMARAVFSPLETVRHEIERELHLDKHEIAAILADSPRMAESHEVTRDETR
ncbi:MAG TPA: Na/Pi symporter [Rhodocyclaceae bacterium]|jgi:phosphate:Na+ symporter|nr:Na/Pi symporter [Rhodocyclaceae bacterium]HRQ45591.1 Na/Pi symporter [Rhodocyclaceae bacterium]